MFMLTDGDASAALRKAFQDLQLSGDCFNSMHYVGVRTEAPPTDFSSFRQTVKKLLRDNSVRSPREPSIIFHALVVRAG